MKLQYKRIFSANKITTALACGALLSSVLAPVAMADSVTISGNGARSVNTVTLSTTTNCTVSQNNVSTVTTSVSNNANTGKNHANDNAGDATITTGAASNTTTVGVTGSSNTATNPCCGCSGSAGNDVMISDNLRRSVNTVMLTTMGTSSVSQGNDSSVSTGVANKAKTGKNKANGNMGGGTSSITTNNASNTTTVTVGGASNQ